MGKKKNSDLRERQQESVANIKKQKDYMTIHEGIDELIVEDIMRNKRRKKWKEV